MLPARLVSRVLDRPDRPVNQRQGGRLAGFARGTASS